MQTKYSVDVVPVSDRAKWMSLTGVGVDAFYHVDYLRLSQQVYGNIPLLFTVCDSGGNRVLYPFIQRSLDTLPFGEARGLFDVITPEYGGPAFLGDQKQRMGLVVAFSEAFERYCRQQKVICEFGRLNPFVPTIISPEEAEFNREIVAVSLVQPEEPLRQYRKGTKSAVHKAIRMGVTVEPMDAGDWSEFYDVYHETMHRNQAKDSYFYPWSFFEYLASVPGVVRGFKAQLDHRIISAALFLVHGGIAHYYLSGSRTDFLSANANALILDCAIRTFKAEGNQILSLGGGYAPNDNLFLFKSGFSSERAVFRIYRRIHDRDQYASLCAARDKAAGTVRVESQFFPYYRLPLT